jgi:hypothetical protein
MPTVIKSNKEILNDFLTRLKEENPYLYGVYRKCMTKDRREFGSMVLFADKLRLPRPVLGGSMRDYLNKIWPFIERYKK